MAKSVRGGAEMTMREMPRQHYSSKDAAVFALRFVLGIVLLLSALAKLRLPYDFLAAVYDYRLFGPGPALVIAASMPWIELVLALCFLGRVCLLGAFFTTILLGVAFSIVIGSALYRQLNIACGCFFCNDEIGPLTLVRSLLVLGGAVLGLILESGVLFPYKQPSPAIEADLRDDVK
jgi:hypothetical protein